MCKDDVIDLYDRHAAAYDRDGTRSLQERPRLNRFLAHVRDGGTILDVGCGKEEPMARYLIDRGFAVLGVDPWPAMIDLCRAQFPDSEWTVADMRSFELTRRCDGILAWDATFHLRVDVQRAMFSRFAALAGRARR